MVCSSYWESVSRPAELGASVVELSSAGVSEWRIMKMLAAELQRAVAPPSCVRSSALS